MKERINYRQLYMREGNIDMGDQREDIGEQREDLGDQRSISMYT